jgi:hypothetical protein
VGRKSVFEIGKARADAGFGGAGVGPPFLMFTFEG